MLIVSRATNISHCNVDPHYEDPQSQTTYLKLFCSTNGLPQICLLAFSFGGVIGCSVAVFPNVTATRYAQQHFGYLGNTFCSTVDIRGNRMSPCYQGNQMAQNATSYSVGLSKNLLSFVMSPIIGQLSDRHGRKLFVLFGIILLLTSNILLLLLIIFDEMDPLWYFLSRSLDGAVTLLAVFFTIISDLVYENKRAVSFGIVLCCFAFGLALTPLLNIALDILHASIFLVSVGVVQVVVATTLLPETLSENARDEAVQRYRENTLSEHSLLSCGLITHPFHDLFRLNKDSFFWRITFLVSLSSMVTSIEFVLLIFYLEENKGFKKADVAIFLAVAGLCTIGIMGILFKPLHRLIGEKGMLLLSFMFGIIQQLLYAVGSLKSLIFLAGAFTGITKLALPVIAAIQSYNVDMAQQGIVQGALFSIVSLSSAVGPLLFRAIYYLFEDVGTLQTGNMFLFSSLLYFIALFISTLLPYDRTASTAQHTNRGSGS